MRRSVVLIVTAILIAFVTESSQPAAARASNVAPVFVVHRDARGDAGIVASPLLRLAASTSDTVPAKGTVKKETLWLMTGLLASVAIAGLVSALRRAKKIRED